MSPSHERAVQGHSAEIRDHIGHNMRMPIWLLFLQSESWNSMSEFSDTRPN